MYFVSQENNLIRIERTGVLGGVVGRADSMECTVCWRGETWSMARRTAAPSYSYRR